ncbi:hypothetical protein D4R75_09640 [bacterium]|nr:MAG: hypothetical protein D4R75_09640 [bacterium]
MDIVTVNVGQGSLALVRHNNEAIVIDSRIPPSGDETVVHVKSTLSAYLKDHYVRGLILTGFDEDHSDARGVAIILKKYQPRWVMYPTYYKNTDQATNVFKVIDEQVDSRRGTSNPLAKKPVRLDKLDSRFLTGLSDNFQFELFSPHIEDMDNSNNSSIVLRLTGNGHGGFSYLITGDTEAERWTSINKFFKSSLRSDVMAAPHHGSRNGVNVETLKLVEPNTILISAGVDNMYGHPDSRAVRVYELLAKHVFGTHVKGGVTLVTELGTSDFVTKIYK